MVVQETPIRVVCSNTLGMALTGPGKKIGVRHTLNVEAKVVDAAKELWGGLIERYRVIAEQYRLLKNTYLDEALFRTLVLDTTAPIKDEWWQPGLSVQQQRARENVEERRHRVAYLWTHGQGHTGDQSAWEAYNAVTATVDHDVALWGSKGEHTASLFNGRLERIKRRTLTELVGYSEENPLSGAR